ncbi:EpsG family protein [Flavobacteriales bacterium]|nr:EpsG family protein [Flavobacteriales bacterium]
MNAVFYRKRFTTVIIGILCFCLYLFAFGGITETTDWLGYEFIFENDEFPIDFTFRFLSSQTKLLGLDYINLYQLHVFLTGALLIFFISRFTSNTFFVTIFLILILFIPLANQIRFFLGLSLFINALYFLCIKRNKFLFLFLGALSVLTHIGIIPLFTFCVIYFIKNDKNYLRTVFSISILYTIVIAVLFTFFGVLAEIGFRENLDSYIQNKYATSFLGTLFQIVPTLIFAFFILTNKTYFKKINHVNDEKLKFLYRLTIFSFLFILPSFFTQIIFFRYCLSLSFVWILLLLYFAKDYKMIKRIRKITVLFVGLWLFVFYIYRMPKIILNSDEVIKKTTLIINSIQFNSQVL